MVLRVGSKLWYIPEAKVTKAISLRMYPRASWLTLRPPSKTNPDPNLGRWAPAFPNLLHNHYNRGKGWLGHSMTSCSWRRFTKNKLQIKTDRFSLQRNWQARAAVAHPFNPSSQEAEKSRSPFVLGQQGDLQWKPELAERPHHVAVWKLSFSP